MHSCEKRAKTSVSGRQGAAGRRATRGGVARWRQQNLESRPRRERDAAARRAGPGDQRIPETLSSRSETAAKTPISTIKGEIIFIITRRTRPFHLHARRARAGKAGKRKE
ncbi:hypothetical protein J6590_017756 [Homalodisca vitripennis]|nr:hypothetical protein J6590_017756 [Homalodisca vitripennis]